MLLIKHEMRQGGESGEMHDYSFGLAAFRPVACRLHSACAFARSETCLHRWLRCGGEGSHLIGMTRRPTNKHARLPRRLFRPTYLQMREQSGMCKKKKKKCMETANVSSHVRVCSAGKTHGWRSCGVFRSRSVEGNNGNGCEIDGGTDAGRVCLQRREVWPINL